MLIYRVATAVVFAPVLLYVVWLGGVPLGITCLCLSTVMLWEFMRMTLGAGERDSKVLGYGLGLATGAAVLGWLPERLDLLLLPLGAMVLLTAAVVRPHPIDQSMRRVAFVTLGVVYTAGLLPFVARLRAVDPDRGLFFALAALFCTWGADTGAYFAGRFFGRHKLYPAVSPGKTIEGGLGGVASAVGAAFLIRWLFSVEIAPLHTALLGAVAGVVGIVGDLSESLLKRSAGAKDSSKLIPGHGGLLDRFDAVMFVAPALYAYVVLTGI